METTAKGWNVLERDGAILWRQYSFGSSGVATTMVFRGAGDGLIVVSPGSRVEESALDELADFGKVVALVASNSFHWLGQPMWRKRFPEARSFAPAQGLKRLAKKMPDARFEPLEALAPLLGDRATVVDPPGFKVGNAFATVRGKSGTYWYPSDLLSNIPTMPSGIVFRTLLSMTNSGPGYRLFRPSVWLQVKDKPVLRKWVDDELAKAAPVAVVPAHGPPVAGSDLVASTKALMAQL
jgi:hypothetical protein